MKKISFYAGGKIAPYKGDSKQSRLIFRALGEEEDSAPCWDYVKA